MRLAFELCNDVLDPYALPFIGGAERDRTDDLLLAKQALSQLSYSPFRCDSTLLPWARQRLESLVGLDGLEPSTPALSRRCSNQLSYRPKSGIRYRVLGISSQPRAR